MPDPIALPGAEQKPVRIVHFRTKIAEESVAIFAVEEHTGQRSEPEAFDWFAQKKSASNGRYCGNARANHELKSARGTRTVHQCEKSQFLVALLRLPQPELCEGGEFLGF